jgi:hypothetical protein
MAVAMLPWGCTPAGFRYNNWGFRNNNLLYWSFRNNNWGFRYGNRLFGSFRYNNWGFRNELSERPGHKLTQREMLLFGLYAQGYQE